MLLTTLFAAASLQAAGMDPLMHNDLHVSAPSGEYTVSFHEDGSYTTDVGISGTWEVVDGEICTTRATGEHACQPDVDQDLGTGDSWTGVNAAGETVTFTLVARDGH